MKYSFHVSGDYPYRHLDIQLDSLRLQGLDHEE